MMVVKREGSWRVGVMMDDRMDVEFMIDGDMRRKGVEIGSKTRSD
jgi:hypothetical protein